MKSVVIICGMYKSTIRASYIGIFILALLSNLLALFFVILRESYGLTFEQVGRFIFINYTTQIVVVLFSSKLVDRYGVRPFIAASHLFGFFGLLLFALSPRIFSGNPYYGFMIGTFIFSIGAGLLELLLSAIMQAIPSDAKAAAMSLLHSFYAWGLIVVVLLTTLMLKIFKSSGWYIIMILWALLPLANFFNFLKVPLAPPVPEEDRTPTKTLISSKYFILVIIGIALGAASEISISQWTPTFAEMGLGLSKTTGDILGLSVFAALLGTGRHLYGKFGKNVKVSKIMFWGAAFAAVCYLVAALAPLPIISLIACAFCGLGVALLWPGSISLAADHFPNAGASIFAILAAGGALGAAIGPWLLGIISDNIPASSALSPLRVGMLVGTIFPLLMMIVLSWIKKLDKSH